MKTSAVQESTRRKNGKNSVASRLAIVFSFLFIFVLFASLPLPGGDDWQTFHGAAQRVLHGIPLYGTRITFSYFYNPPWLALVLSPLGMLPFRWGWAALSTISILTVFFLCRRWNMSATKLAVLLFSPPMLYIFLHGNIDALILGMVLLPREYWLVAALTKPQTAIALMLGVLRANLLKALLITGSVILLSFILFGNWIIPYFSQPIELLDGGHNVFRGLWPYQAAVGIVLAFIGWKRNDEKFLIGASPFFSPYAATSSMLGPLMLLVSKMKDWQAVLFILLYWAGSVWLAMH